MGTKVKKSILKPLKYISLMLDSKEPEIQIGLPTDVKHVAHIGWDGPNVSAPGWMNEYNSVPLSSTSSSVGDERKSPATNLCGSQEIKRVEESPSQTTGPSSRLGSSSVEDDLPNNIAVSGRARHARRHQSDGTASTEPSEGPSRRSRKPRKKEVADGGTDLSAQDLPANPKQSHRRRPKGSAGASGESIRSSRSKASTTSAVENAAYQESNTNSQQQLYRTPEEEEDSE